MQKRLDMLPKLLTETLCSLTDKDDHFAFRSVASSGFICERRGDWMYIYIYNRCMCMRFVCASLCGLHALHFAFRSVGRACVCPWLLYAL